MEKQQCKLVHCWEREARKVVPAYQRRKRGMRHTLKPVEVKRSNRVTWSCDYDPRADWDPVATAPGTDLICGRYDTSLSKLAGACIVSRTDLSLTLTDVRSRSRLYPSSPC